MIYRLLLVCEDDATMRQLHSVAKAHKAVAADAVGDAREALARIAEGDPYHLVFTEWAMDQVNGLHILSAIKRRAHNTLVTIVGGYGDHESMINAIRLGVYAYLHKPFRPSEAHLLLNNMTEKLFLTDQVRDLSEKLARTAQESAKRGQALEKAERELAQFKEKEAAEKAEAPVKRERDLRALIAKAANEKAVGARRYDAYSDLNNLHKMREELMITEDEYQRYRRAVLERTYSSHGDKPPKNTDSEG